MVLIMSIILCINIVFYNIFSSKYNLIRYLKNKNINIVEVFEYDLFLDEIDKPITNCNCCTYCNQTLIDDNEIIYLNCGHSFHTKCISKNKNLYIILQYCPICKKKFDKIIIF